MVSWSGFSVVARWTCWQVVDVVEEVVAVRNTGAVLGGSSFGDGRIKTSAFACDEPNCRWSLPLWPLPFPLLRLRCSRWHAGSCRFFGVSSAWQTRSSVVWVCRDGRCWSSRCPSDPTERDSCLRLRENNSRLFQVEIHRGLLVLPIQSCFFLSEW